MIPRPLRRLFLSLLAAAAAAAPSLAREDLSPDELLRSHLWREFVSLPKGKRPVVGLALSGGAARAAAQAGVITALDRARFPVDVVAGTSMGAIIGSLYAAGDSPRRIRTIVERLKASTGSNFNALSFLALILWKKPLSTRRTEIAIDRELGSARFEDLPKPFACVAMDLDSGEEIILRDGPVGRAVRASMSLPGLFGSVEYRHRHLVDGGVVDFVPVDAARLLGAQWVLASVTESDYTRSRPENALQSLQQALDIRGSLLSREQSRSADFLIEPGVGHIRYYESGRIREAVDAGIVAAFKKIPAAEESLLLRGLPSLLESWRPSSGADPLAASRGGP